MATYTSKFANRLRKPIAALGIGIRSTETEHDDDVQMVTAVTAATEPDGSIYLTGGVPQVMISSAKDTFAVLGQTPDFGATGIKTDLIVESASGVTIETADVAGAGTSSNISITTGDAAGAGISGDIDLTTGTTVGGTRGRIALDGLSVDVTAPLRVDAITEYSGNAGTELQQNRSLTSDIIEDFDLNVGGTLPAPWAKDEQTANGYIGNYVLTAGPGVYRLLSDATNEAQAGQLVHDALDLNASEALIIEARIQFSPEGAAFTADERLVVGVCSAHTNAEDSLDNVVTNAWFRIEGASMAILVEADDGTTDTDDQDSTIVLVKGAWTVLRIDLSDLSDVKFYVDGVEQGGAVVTMAALGANTHVMPIICAQRDAGAEANTLLVDYVRIIRTR